MTLPHVHLRFPIYIYICVFVLGCLWICLFIWVVPLVVESFQDPCLGFVLLILWFDYPCVDRTLSPLHGGSGSLIRWPHGREVVTSYHLGSPQIKRYWMFVDAVVLLSFLFLPWKHSIHMLYPCIYVFCILRSYEMMYCLLMYLYLLLYTLWQV